METPRPYQSYFGGKSGNGTYQTLINFIPPCDVFASLFLGNCAVTRLMKLPNRVILNDLDPGVLAAWSTYTVNDYSVIQLRNDSAHTVLADILQEAELRPHLSYFIFLDPPYLLNTRRNSRPVYKFELYRDGHTYLLSKISEISLPNVKVMICCYPNDLYELYLHNWRKHEFYSTIRNGVALERIYMNYKIGDELQDYRYLGNDYREREKIKRMQENVIKKLTALPGQLRNSIKTELIEALNNLK